MKNIEEKDEQIIKIIIGKHNYKYNYNLKNGIEGCKERYEEVEARENTLSLKQIFPLYVKGA